MKPVRLPAAATIALPRWAILTLCLLYILPGLIGRDPWKGPDAASFGVMWTMAHGNLNDWLWPHVVGLPMPEEGPLAYWLGALCIKIFGGIDGALTRHGIGDEQGFNRPGEILDRFDFFHELFVDRQSARRVEHYDVVAFLASGF